MTHLPPVFQKILGDTLQAYGLTRVEYPEPRPPEEVRQILASQPNNEVCSADAI